MLTVACPVFERRRLSFDGDAALTLQIHGIEHLRLHLAIGEAAAQLDEAVGQRRFSVVDVSDNGKIPNLLHKKGASGIRKGPNSDALCIA